MGISSAVDVAAVEAVLGYEFVDKALLDQGVADTRLVPLGRRRERHEFLGERARRRLPGGGAPRVRRAPDDAAARRAHPPRQRRCRHGEARPARRRRARPPPLPPPQRAKLTQVREFTPEIDRRLTRCTPKILADIVESISIMAASTSTPATTKNEFGRFFGGWLIR